MPDCRRERRPRRWRWQSPPLQNEAGPRRTPTRPGASIRRSNAASSARASSARCRTSPRRPCPTRWTRCISSRSSPASAPHASPPASCPPGGCTTSARSRPPTPSSGICAGWRPPAATAAPCVTSMRQLVAGLARIHPAWDMTGDAFQARDRHYQAVRRRIRDLQEMGLIDCRIGHDLDGEERRTEIELKPAPQVAPQELAAAAATLARWQNRYGPALNTGSRTGIRNAARHGRPLTASERQRRGCHHARQAAAARRSRSSRSNSPPPSGASAALRKGSLSDNSKPLSDPSGSSRTGVTRTRASTPVRSRRARSERQGANTGHRGERGGWRGAPRARRRSRGPACGCGGGAVGSRGADRQGQGETGRTRAADRRDRPAGARPRRRGRRLDARTGVAARAAPRSVGRRPVRRHVRPPIAGLRPLARSSASGTCSCGVPWPAGSATAKPGPRDGPPAGSRRCCTSEPSLPRARSPIRHACSPTRSVASTSSQSACEPTTPPPARSASTTPRPAPAAAANPPPRRSSTTGPPGPRGSFCQDTPSPHSTSTAGSSSTSSTPRPAGSRRPTGDTYRLTIRDAHLLADQPLPGRRGRPHDHVAARPRPDRALRQARGALGRRDRAARARPPYRRTHPARARPLPRLPRRVAR